MITPAQGRAEGEARKHLGITLAALHKEHKIRRAQLAMLEAATGRPEKTCTSDDIPEDLAIQYADGGKWVGAAVRALPLAKLLEHIGYAKSSRPSRHSNEVKVWRVRDERKVQSFMEELRLWLQRNPLPPQPDYTKGLFGEEVTP